MKTFCFIMIFGILLLAACTPTTTSTTVAVLPTAIPTNSPTQPPTSIPLDTLTPTPLPQGKTIIVTSTSDSGPGTLRQALIDAQPYDTITFDPAIFPPDAPVTIFVSSELPHPSFDNPTYNHEDCPSTDDYITGAA